MKKDVDLRRIMKLREDIRKGEAKERELQEYLKTQREQLRQQENDYIVKKTRELLTSGDDVLDILKVTQELVLGDDTEEEEQESESAPVSKMYEEDYMNE